METDRHNFSQAKRLFHGRAYYAPAHDSKRGVEMTPLYLFSCVPEAPDADGICETQAVGDGGAGGTAIINGALASNGVAEFDVPRNVVAAWTGTAVITIEGEDEYGARVVEQSASGTSHTGKKAFKRVTRITTSAAVTGFTAGTGSAIGFPYRVDAGGFFMASLDGNADDGTFAPAVTAAPSATTGDVRGTYTPDGTLDGSARLAALFKIADPTTKEGAYGVDQYGG